MQTLTPVTIKTIAHVGHTGTPADSLRLMEVITWMADNGYDLPYRPGSDFLDLRHGRDFLAEEKCYDVVVLHFLFRGGFGIPFGVTMKGHQGKQLSTSPLATWSAWRRRLVASNALLVFAFGGLAEVSGTYLCNLNGYRVHKVRTEQQDAFSRNEGHSGLWVFEKGE